MSCLCECGCQWDAIARTTKAMLPEKLRQDFAQWVAQSPIRIDQYTRGPEGRKALVLAYYREFADRVLEGVRLA